jgi:CheY-like chemotaxis protein
MNGGVMNAGIVDENGWFWIPNQRGVNFFNPEDFHEPKPNIQFEQVQLVTQKNRYHVSNKPKLLSNERTFTVEFQLLNSYQRKNRSFSYRIANQDSVWREIGNKNSFLVANLSSGLQIIEIKLNNTPSTSPVITTAHVFIHPYWYESPLVLSGLFGLLSGSIILIFISITRSAKKKQDILNSKVIERTQELESQRKKTVEALEVVQQQALELQEIDSIKTEYFIRLTHELRTPLSLIKGPLELILEQLDNDSTENLKHRLEGIKQNTENIYNLIDKLLELYRFNLDSFTLKKEMVNLTQVTKQFIDDYASRHPEEYHAIQFSAQESHIRLELDTSLWDILLTHLFTISFSYLKKQEPLHVHLKAESNKAILMISNFASELSENEINQLFKLFYDTEEYEHLKGTGIGLSLAKKYVELMKGSIEIQTKSGIHHLQITLPDVILSINLEPKTEIKTAVDITETFNEIHSDLPIIQIVDDNIEFSKFMVTLLGNEYRVFTALNGFEALQQLQNIKPDLIVSDVMMPKMNGFEFARQARQLPGFLEIPLIFLTAKNTEQAIQEGLQTGAQAYLTKPVSNNILKAKIKALLRRKTTTKILAEKAEHQPNPFKVKLDELIMRHLSDPQLGMESIADAFHMSKSSLYRKWLEVSPNEQLNAYIIRLRLEETIKLVKENNLTFGEASFVCGFSNPSYFSRIFKKVYRCTPSEYIEKKA